MNRLRVIEMLYRHPASSRTDLARMDRALAGDRLRAGRGAAPAPASSRSTRLRTPAFRALPGARRWPCRSCPAPASRSGWTSATSTYASRSATSRASSSPTTGPRRGRPRRDREPRPRPRARAREPAQRRHRADRLLGVGMGLAAPINRATGEIAATASCPAGTASARRPRCRRASASRSSSRTTPTSAPSARRSSARPAASTTCLRAVSAGIGAGLILGGRRTAASPASRARSGTSWPTRRADLPLRQPRLPGDRRQPRGGRRAAGAQHRRPRLGRAPARARRGRRPRRAPRGGRRRRGGRPRARRCS